MRYQVEPPRLDRPHDHAASMMQTTPPGGDLAMQLFDLAPTSLWLQDLSALKTRLDGWASEGMTDLRLWLSDPEHLLTCQRLIRIVRINRQTLLTYEARDEAELFAHIPTLFHDPHATALVEVLCQLWSGATQARLVTRNRTVAGRVIDVSYAGQMLPGSEAAWDRYLISIEDITAREEQRRQEEARLETLSLTDPLTGLRNRAGYEADLGRFEGVSPVPVSVIVADLNGLKEANDLLGHEAGDALIRAFAAILEQQAPAPARVARIGGDEFVLLLPVTERDEAAALVRRIVAALEAGPSPLSAALGVETWTGEGPLKAAIARADAQMYAAKRRHYDTAPDAPWNPADAPGRLPRAH
ncbi:GGDEF domain-containing protein [Methylobacterium currus]|jgi:diguanylate cyclase (GGDEF)-like protein|uniref:diguanylate cyclase n=2 Tax=Methylobacterium currus TaxID=2051553 RepID=A0A2R4WQE5_9HYPH|nr:GGDEF domain-containing protein [Methylobacterium currus]